MCFVSRAALQNLKLFAEYSQIGTKADLMHDRTVGNRISDNDPIADEPGLFMTQGVEINRLML
jgi:hypothetical protein